MFTARYGLDLKIIVIQVCLLKVLNDISCCQQSFPCLTEHDVR